MALYIITCSHQRSHWTHEGCLEYTKRISKFEDIHHIELKRKSYASKINPKEIQTQETKRILSLIPKQSLTVICDYNGKQTDSLSFSQQLVEQQLKSPNITWIIGPAYGLDMQQLQSYVKISLSKLTFPHEMAKLILLEQIYRALTIQHNHPYHL